MTGFKPAADSMKGRTLGNSREADTSVRRISSSLSFSEIKPAVDVWKSLSASRLEMDPLQRKAHRVKIKLFLTEKLISLGKFL